MQFLVPQAVAATPVPPRPPAGASPPRAPAPQIDLDDLDDIPGLADDEFDVPASATPAPKPVAAPNASSATRPRKQGIGSREAFARLSLGLKTIYWGTMLSFASWVLVIAVNAIQRLRGVDLADRAAYLVYALFAIGAVVSLVGRLITLAAPVRVDGKVWIVLAALFDVAACVGTVLTAAGQVAIGVGLLVSLAVAPLIVLFYSLFLRQLALTLGRTELVSDAKITIGVVGGFFVAFLIWFIFPPAVLVVFGTLLFAMAKYLHLLTNLAETPG
jgi:hypothetical protein